MLSKGSKLDYLCPLCESPKIYKHPNNCGFYMMRGKGICTACHSFWAWSRRNKISIKNKHRRHKPPVRLSWLTPLKRTLKEFYSGLLSPFVKHTLH